MCIEKCPFVCHLPYSVSLTRNITLNRRVNLSFSLFHVVPSLSRRTVKQKVFENSCITGVLCFHAEIVDRQEGILNRSHSLRSRRLRVRSVIPHFVYITASLLGSRFQITSITSGYDASTFGHGPFCVKYKYPKHRYHQERSQLSPTLHS